MEINDSVLLKRNKTFWKLKQRKCLLSASLDQKETFEVEDVNRSVGYMKKSQVKNVLPVEESDDRRGRIHMAAKKREKRK